MSLSDSHRIWSFDIGTGSVGYSIRGYKEDPNEFSAVDVLLVPDEFASIKDARTRRRMMRTRQAHKAREEWLRTILAEAGLEVLHGKRLEKDPSGKGWKSIPGDARLEREFPALGDETVYCGAVLRIRLLQGERLEPWQIFKAFHSAIQKRGYDPEVPWKRRSANDGRDEEEEAETKKRCDEFLLELAEIADEDSPYHYPCYWEAWKMGLWSPENPAETRIRITHEAESARNAVYPRAIVEREILDLFAQAEIQYPSLGGRAVYLLYGPTEKPYASYKSDPSIRAKFESETSMRLVRGKETDWMGVLSQKIPNFDNRSPEDCCLIPRLRVAKSSPRIHGGNLVPESMLPAEVSFLMKLKNLRFSEPGGQRGFTSEEIRTVFERCRAEADDAVNKTIQDGKGGESAVFSALDRLRLTKTALSKIVLACGGSGLLPNHEAVDPPKAGGRARFSRPTLRLVRDLILSGEDPSAFRERILVERVAGNTNRVKGLINEDLDFLQRMGTTWDGIYVPDEALARSQMIAGAPLAEREDEIRHLIASQIDPIVRHRLTLFHGLLAKLRDGIGGQSAFGVPDRIVLEFVREDFMGPKRKMALRKFQNDRRSQRAEARKQAAELGGSLKDELKIQILKDQGWQCVYTGESIGQGDLDQLTIDHIVPRSAGGPDAYTNYIVCHRRTNDEKADRTPYMWLRQQPGWDAYVARVKGLSTSLRNKKVQLLISEDAIGLVDRYQKLAETAWIAKLAQTIVCLFFGWPLNFAGMERRVVTLPGGLTHRIADRNHLYGLLNQEIETLGERSREGDPKAEDSKERKIREDKRHHALDAMVLSFLPAWTADPTKRLRHRLPDGVDRAFFGRYLSEVLPTYACFQREPLRDTIYGARRDPSGRWLATLQCKLAEMAFDVGPDGKPKGFSLSKLKSRASRILDEGIRRRVLEFVETAGDATMWQAFCETFRANATGPIVRKVKCVADKSNPDDFLDLSKDRSGQFRTSKEGHQGQFVYVDHKGTPRVRPVRVFESKKIVENDLRRSKDFTEMLGFFQTKCTVSLTKPVDHGVVRLTVDYYILNSIGVDGRADLTSSDGTKYIRIPLKKLLPAGFSRVTGG
jgi:CRISPR-associated endonuclease Csn1